MPDAATLADTSIARMVDYALALDPATLPDAVVHECKRRLIDTFGCAIGGYDEPAAEIARRLALAAPSASGASVLGTRARAVPELAVFANGVAMRCLDGNDCYPGGGGHPSGVSAPVLAAGQIAGADATLLLSAIAVGYDVHYRLWQAARVLRQGFDHGIYSAVAAAAGAAKVLGLGREAFANALAIAVTPNLPLAVTRRGALSMWKGCAEAHAAKNGYFAAELARYGMTGPALAVEGAMGLQALFGPFELAPFPNEGGRFAILDADMKYYVTEYHSQGPIMLALKLARDIDIDAIAAIAIDTYEFAYREIGSGAEKWRPLTRETADHSMPYIVAAALRGRGFTDAAFAPEKFTDPNILRIADKITIREDTAFNHRGSAFPCRMTMTLADGTTKTASLDYPHGHHRDAMNDAEVEAKFRDLAGRKLGGRAVDAMLAALWSCDQAANADDLLALTDIERGRAATLAPPP